MYEMQQDTKPQVIAQRTTSLEKSIQSLMDLIGPRDGEPNPWKVKIDLTTTPIQFAIADSALVAAQHSLDAVIANVKTTNDLATQVAAG